MKNIRGGAQTIINGKPVTTIQLSHITNEEMGTALKIAAQMGGQKIVHDMMSDSIKEAMIA